MQRSTGGRLGSHRLIAPGDAARLGWRQVIVRSCRRRYCKMPPARWAVICRSRTRSPASPALVSTAHISERWAATRLGYTCFNDGGSILQRAQKIGHRHGLFADAPADEDILRSFPLPPHSSGGAAAWPRPFS